MTELPNDYERRALAFRLLSSLAHEMEQSRFHQALDDAMKDPNLREAVAYLVGLTLERFRAAHGGDWSAAVADIDLNLRLAEDLTSLDDET